MDVIERYLDEVLVANETTNLTRIVSRESAVRFFGVSVSI